MASPKHHHVLQEERSHERAGTDPHADNIHHPRQGDSLTGVPRALVESLLVASSL